MGLVDSIVATIRAIVGLHESFAIAPAQRIRQDLGISSLQLVVILTDLCDAHGVALSELSAEDVNGLATVADIASLIERRRGEPGGAQPASAGRTDLRGEL